MILPVVTNCDGCGACCMHMGTPPGYAMAFSLDAKLRNQFNRSEDGGYLAAAPVEVRAELADYYRKVFVTHELEDRTAHDDLPCLWWDLGTRKCKHHEFRPSVCREFEIGSQECIDHRIRRGIPT